MKLPGKPLSGINGLLEETTEDLYEHAPCGYLSTLPDGTIVKINGTLLDWLGFIVDSLPPGATFQGLLAIGSRIYYETHFAPLLRMQGFVKEIALDLTRADGRVLPVLVNARQRCDDSGTPLFNRVTIFDATDRRRYERELLLARRKAEQNAKDKADLLAMLSHDIRSPLTALMGTVGILERDPLTPMQHESVRVLQRATQHMLTLLDHVLTMSRAESRSAALTETRFHVRTLVEETVATFEAAAAAKSLDLRAAVDDQVPADAIGDPIALRQILVNLVGNAIKFTPCGAVLLSVTTAERSADHVTLQFAVADTGVGIAAEDTERIFEPFTQASDDTAEKFGGSGLGLAITRRLLALYDSSIELTSSAGQGSTFSFSLRLAVPRRRGA